MRELVLVTGSMRAGKTSLCKALFRILRQKTARPFGIIEENRRDDRGIPLVIDLLDLATGESIAFASRKAVPEGLSQERASPGNGYPPFAFRAEAFAWAMDRLKAAIEGGCGPVILDEIGALEIRQGGGFLKVAVWAMDHGESPLVLTLRPEFEESLLVRLSAMTATGPAKRFRADDSDAETLASTIADYLFSIARPVKGLYSKSRNLLKKE